MRRRKYLNKQYASQFSEIGSVRHRKKTKSLFKPPRLSVHMYIRTEVCHTSSLYKLQTHRQSGTGIVSFRSTHQACTYVVMYISTLRMCPRSGYFPYLHMQYAFEFYKIGSVSHGRHHTFQLHFSLTVGSVSRHCKMFQDFDSIFSVCSYTQKQQTIAIYRVLILVLTLQVSKVTEAFLGQYIAI